MILSVFRVIFTAAVHPEKSGRDMQRKQWFSKVFAAAVQLQRNKAMEKCAEQW